MNQDLIDRVTEGLPTGANVLHTAEEGGTVAVVYESLKGVRHYYAQEFTNDGTEAEPVMIESAGYNTPERHWYMGDRYKSRTLWGPHFPDVYWVDNESQPRTAVAK